MFILLDPLTSFQASKIAHDDIYEECVEHFKSELKRGRYFMVAVSIDLHVVDLETSTASVTDVNDDNYDDGEDLIVDAHNDEV